MPHLRGTFVIKLLVLLAVAVGGASIAVVLVPLLPVSLDVRSVLGAVADFITLFTASVVWERLSTGGAGSRRPA